MSKAMQGKIVRIQSLWDFNSDLKSEIQYEVSKNVLYQFEKLFLTNVVNSVSSSLRNINNFKKLNQKLLLMLYYPHLQVLY